MPLEAWWSRAAGDPLLAYALLAASVLAAASLIGGWTSGDLRSLTRAGPWTAAALAAIAALALTIAGERTVMVAPDAWPVQGIRRLPLYLVALGYGPTMGVVAAGLFAGVERIQEPVPAAEVVLVLEMAVVGWLAIAPSPRRVRFAASFAVLVGWAMAMGTAGLAALAWLYRPLPLETWLTAVRADLPGVLAAAVLVALLPPSWWRRAAPGAVPGVTGAEGSGAAGDGRGPEDEEGEAVIPSMRRGKRRSRPTSMETPLAPRALARAPRDPRRPTPASVPEAPMRLPNADEATSAPRGKSE